MLGVYELIDLCQCYWTLYGLYLNHYETLRLAWTYLRPFMVIPMHWSTYALDLRLWTLGLVTLLITLININHKDLS